MIAALIAIGSVGFVVAGAWMVIWPDHAARVLPEFREDATPTQARWNARAVGLVMLFFGWVGLYVVFVEGLRPFPPGENGVGF